MRPSLSAFTVPTPNALCCKTEPTLLTLVSICFFYGCDPGNVYDSMAFDDVYNKVTQQFPEIETVGADSTYKTLQ